MCVEECWVEVCIFPDTILSEESSVDPGSPLRTCSHGNSHASKQRNGKWHSSFFLLYLQGSAVRDRLL